MLGLPLLELFLFAREIVFGLRQAATAFVEFALASLQGGIAVVQALLDAGDLGPPGAHLRLGVVFDLQRRFFGREIGLPAFGLGFALCVLR